MALASEMLLGYRKAGDIAAVICAVTEHFPRGYEYLADQRSRATE